MLVRELIARGEAARVLVVAPAGLLENWRNELAGCFRLTFDVLGRDFRDHGAATWERYPRVIGSIDTLKQHRRMQRLLAAPPWDLVIFDEAHHLSRTRSGKKTTTTRNYRLAEALRNHSRDLLFLSATPHQGNAFQFWSLIQLLDDQLFAGPEAVADHRGLLNHVMIRRTRREVTDPRGDPIFRRRQVHTERFPLGPRERMFYERIGDYLREGYDAAGVGDAAGVTGARTTRRQRAIGFVMTTFQKIMSSSPRAIRQALRRRLLVLLARRQLELESRRTRARTHRRRRARRRDPAHPGRDAGGGAGDPGRGRKRNRRRRRRRRRRSVRRPGAPAPATARGGNRDDELDPGRRRGGRRGPLCRDGDPGGDPHRPAARRAGLPGSGPALRDPGPGRQRPHPRESGRTFRHLHPVPGTRWPSSPRSSGGSSERNGSRHSRAAPSRTRLPRWRTSGARTAPASS